ncbi:MAG TPA: response regulator [Polyangia bacterium]|nr:response regulator [Polyangia bacterium]
MGKRILIADDSVTIQKAFAMTLVGEDFAVTAARSADEGLTLARQMRPDLVIADAAMPGRSGYELCAALKADAALRGIPVYILSSTHRPYDEAKGQQVGADGNLVKPWETGGLIEKLKGATGLAAGAARPASPASRPASALPTAAVDADYSVDVVVRDTASAPARTTAPVQPVQTMAPAAPAQPAARPAAPSGMPAGGLRPSLIPGVRPGAMPPSRPGTSPSRTLGGTTPIGPSVPPRPASAAPMGRTLFGLPAASMPFPGAPRPAPASVAHAPAPAHAPTPAHAPAPAHAPSYAPEPMAARSAASPALSTAVGSMVDQKVAAMAARGPEYEALAKLSREVIEQIVWEIVPELADAIIREHVAKRGTA